MFLSIKMDTVLCRDGQSSPLPPPPTTITLHSLSFRGSAGVAGAGRPYGSDECPMHCLAALQQAVNTLNIENCQVKNAWLVMDGLFCRLDLRSVLV